jgi:alkanesulfonate monooxygenase SsuD/methylene tetrahydromethanopterin reductase-like flavin-dependent oxidoreductase (luciferase family)
VSSPSTTRATTGCSSATWTGTTSRPSITAETSRPAGLRFAVDIPNFGDFADPRVVADLARRAEEAGWDGLFVWDHVTHRKELRRQIADPWILLTAAALATATIRLATLITPVARRRVSKLAREVTTLDRLSAGRMTLGVGLGAPIADEFGSFGEPTDPRELADHLDEGLEALNLLWSGEPVTYHRRTR